MRHTSTQERPQHDALGKGREDASPVVSQSCWQEVHPDGMAILKICLRRWETCANLPRVREGLHLPYAAEVEDRQEQARDTHRHYGRQGDN